MPRISRQDRYNLLLIPENTYNALTPHPQTQTLYTYPFNKITASITLNIFTITMNLGHWLVPKTYIAHISALILAILLPLFILVHPAVGLRKRRFVETPTGVEVIHVLRPFFGRRSCESQYGLTGGYPYKIRRSWWSGEVFKRRYEPALWVVDW